MNLLKLKKNLKKFLKTKKKNNQNYSLLDDAFSSEDLIKGIEVILSKKITMGEITFNFEKEFAKYIGSKYALMTNSGSSANLLASFALVNPKKKNFLKTGDEFLIQALCWSTSLWPLVQAGLKPRFIDVNLKTFNLDINKVKSSINKRTKAIMAVHVLGNSSKILELSKLCKKNKIFLIEDTCESLGSKYNSKYLGTFGDFGTYSFYYSHQITSGEGGMLVCDNKENYEIVHSLRSHGWDRGLNKNKINKPTFNFINSGFNLRPTDIAAAIGMNQFKRLNSLKSTRSENREKILYSLKKAKSWNNQFTFFNPIENLEPSWFGFPLLINKKFIKRKKSFLKYLEKNKIETRPIISGNFMNQPSVKLYNFKKKKTFVNAQEIEDRGFFIGLHTEKITDFQLEKLTNCLLKIDSF
jgi:CDP-4-dehydro-6-deoxyglucose reductase, E1